MKRVYPIIIKQNGKDFLVFVPDMEIYTEGKDEFDAIVMARDAIGLKGIEMEDMNIALPEASTYEGAIALAKKDTDEEFDFSDGLLTFVDVDFAAYRNKLRNRAVKKNCTIPYWLNEKAEAMGLNFSKVLQNALMEQVGEQN